LSDFQRTLTVLEEAVHDLLESGWDEPRRRRAHELAVALADAAKASGWKETGGVVRAIASLLALSLGEVIGVRVALRERLLELLDVLKDSPASETA
jgi:hypothetical protein